MVWHRSAIRKCVLYKLLAKKFVNSHELPSNLSTPKRGRAHFDKQQLNFSYHVVWCKQYFDNLPREQLQTAKNFFFIQIACQEGRAWYGTGQPSENWMDG